MSKPVHAPKTFVVTVSAGGFTPDHLKVDQGDTVDFQGAPTSVTVTAGGTVSDPTVLFGTASIVVPSSHVVLTNFGAFHLDAGSTQATLIVRDSREIMANDPPPKTH
jgi:hypothetical protein